VPLTQRQIRLDLLRPMLTPFGEEACYLVLWQTLTAIRGRGRVRYAFGISVEVFQDLYLNIG
jgi:hypothetical protein